MPLDEIADELRGSELRNPFDHQSFEWNTEEKAVVYDGPDAERSRKPASLFLLKREPVSPHRRALIELHVCVVLWGFTAILGKLITLPAQALVWWRMLLVTLALACFPRVWRALAGIPLRLIADLRRHRRRGGACTGWRSTAR